MSMRLPLILRACGLLTAGLLLAGPAAAQPTPAPAQRGSVLVLHATAHLGTGDVVANSGIGFRDGRIDYVGSAETVPRSYDRVIDATGMHLYPGFIAANSTLGLVEIEAVRASADVYEIGTFRPNVRSVIAYNTDSEVTPTVRSNGVLVGQITPRGGTVSGSSGIVQFDAWNWEDAVIREVDGVHVNWPGMHHRHREGEKVEVRRRKTYDQELHELRRFFSEAAAYARVARPDPVDVRFEAMRGLFSGDLALYVHADDVRQITAAVHFKREFNLPRLVLVGGSDAPLVADLLRDNAVPVLVARLHRLPRFEDDPVDLPFSLPKLLEDEGVLYALEGSGNMEAMSARNLPFYAGTAHAYGLTYEQAVRSITLNAARILGVDQRLGSIEVGKDATFFLSAGDALDIRTNRVQHAFIGGREIDLDNRQRELYRKFAGKYGQPIVD